MRAGVIKQRAPFLLCASLGFGIVSLAVWQQGILEFLAMALALAAALGFILKKKPVLATASILAGCSSMVFLSGSVHRAYIRAGFEEYESRQIEKTARNTKTKFERRLTGLDEQALHEKKRLRTVDAEKITSLDLKTARSRELPSGTGVAVYDPDGAVLAWIGDIPVLDGSDISQNLKPYFLKRSRNSYLYRTLPTHGGVRIVSVGARLDPTLFGSASQPSVDTAFVDSREDASALSNRFSSAGDQLWAKAMDGTQNLHFPLRSPEGEVLALVSIKARPLVNVLSQSSRWSRAIGGVVLVLCLILVALQFFRLVECEPDLSFRSLGSFIGLVCAVSLFRFILYRYVPLDALLPHGVFSPDRFASNRLFGLLRSPGDTFLTAFLTLVLVLVALRRVLLHLRLRTSPVRQGIPFWVLFVISPALSLVSTVWFQGLLAEGVRNTDMDLLDFSLLRLSPSNILVNLGLIAILASVSILVTLGMLLPVQVLMEARRNWVLDIFPWIGWTLFPLLFVLLNDRIALPQALLSLPPGPNLSVPLIPSILIYLAPVLIAWGLAHTVGGGSGNHRITRTAVLSCMLLVLPFVHYFSILHHDFRNRQSLIRNTVKPAVEAQKSTRRLMLQHILGELPGQMMERLPPERPGELAFSIWSDSPLSTYGYSSSVDVYDESGNLISHFSFNLPVEPKDAPLPSSSPFSIDEEYESFGSPRTRVLRGFRSIDIQRDSRLSIVIRISEGYDDLPFFRRQGQLHNLALRGHTASALTGHEGTPLILTVFDKDGNNLYATPFDSPAPELTLRRRTQLSGRPGWQTLTDGQRKADLYLFQNDERVFAVGFWRKNLREHAVDLINTVFFSLALLLIARVPLLAGSADPTLLRPAGILHAVTSRFSRKLFASLLAVAIIPMILLSFYLKGYVSSVKVREIEDSARSSLESARRIIEEYLSTFKEETGTVFDRVDDTLLIWVGDLIHHDLTLFRGPMLHATNIRGLYLSEALPARVDGVVFDHIYKDRETYVSKRRRINGLILLEASVPVTVDGPIPAGVLSLASALGEEDIRREAAAFNEVLFVLGALLCTAIFLISYSLSKRISGPIRSLTMATSEITRGNFDLRLQAASKDEIRSLVESFNLMASNIKERQEELKREKETIERIIHHATTGVLAVDPDNRISTFNPAAMEILGLTGTEFMGKEILPLLTRKPGLKGLASFLGSHLGRSRTEVGGELRITRQTEERAVRVMVIPILERQGGAGIEATVVLIEDVTEILRSEKLKVWAELSKKIAHEVKNPLTPIKLAVDHLQNVFRRGDSDLPQVLEKCSATILKQVENLRRLSLDFLNLATERKPVCIPTQLPDFLKEVISPYQTSPPPRITIELNLSDNLPGILIDPELMGRALVNLIENAIQALPGGGKINLAAQRAHESGRDWVKITVSDTGKGVKGEARASLFEPYFSTKSEGTGLGLAIARKIVTDHGGILRLDGVPGPGASFSILLEAGGEEMG